jgi:hypothetical protein
MFAETLQLAEVPSGAHTPRGRTRGANPPDQTLRPTFAVQALLEAPQQVRAHAIGDRISLLFGDNVHGIRFIGNRDDLWRLTGRAGRHLATLAEDGQA